MDRQPPFTTPAGVQIGCMYKATRPVFHDRDALKLQSALLNRRQPSATERNLVGLVRRFWAWC
jgi:hypothetical protein